ncbi:hypothetical protein CATMIT_01788, partial [Catenibacterium mitsuokai DSM 15897]
PTVGAARAATATPGPLRYYEAGASSGAGAGTKKPAQLHAAPAQVSLAEVIAPQHALKTSAAQAATP